MDLKASLPLAPHANHKTTASLPPLPYQHQRRRWSRGALAAPFIACPPVLANIMQMAGVAVMPGHPHLAHLRPFARQPIVFVTIVTHRRCARLANAPAFDTLTAIWRNSPTTDGWFVGDYLLMPDHVHLFARSALDAKPLAGWMETWKSLSARRFKPTLGFRPPTWQRDYFDRFLRSSGSYAEKWDYVAMNPVRAGRRARSGDWPWKGRLFDPQF